jgi:hypothetical protein
MIFKSCGFSSLSSVMISSFTLDVAVGAKKRTGK